MCNASRQDNTSLLHQHTILLGAGLQAVALKMEYSRPHTPRHTPLPLVTRFRPPVWYSVCLDWPVHDIARLQRVQTALAGVEDAQQHKHSCCTYANLLHTLRMCTWPLCQPMGAIRGI